MLHCINKNHTLEALSISKLHQSGRHSEILSGCDQMFGCTCALSAYHTHEQLIKTACIVETTEMESLMRRAFIGIVADWTCYEPIGIQVWGPRVARSNQAAYLSSQINIQLETRNSARSRSPSMHRDLDSGASLRAQMPRTRPCLSQPSSREL